MLVENIIYLFTWDAHSINLSFQNGYRSLFELNTIYNSLICNNHLKIDCTDLKDEIKNFL